MRIIHVAGARPNFMKVAPVMKALGAHPGVEQLLVHTGQHYDASMSDVFFRDLRLPTPDVFLGVGSGSHAEQTAKVMVAFENVCLERKPDVIVVVGDVNSTLACAIDAAKLCIRCAHVEAGLRSNDLTMPEEINRIVTDRICGLLLTPSADADENLRSEGVASERIVRVGNVMIDTLRSHLEEARRRAPLKALGLEPQQYAVLTLHRPSNVDDRPTFVALLEALTRIQAALPVVFPLHPRTLKRIQEHGLESQVAGLPGLKLVDPMGYHEFLGLTAGARLVLTDSGGLQEETTALGVPCLTLRQSTERPITETEGTNTVVGTDPQRILGAFHEVLSGRGKAGRIPDLWEGKAAERVADALIAWADR